MQHFSDVTPALGVAIGCTATGGGANPVFSYHWQRDGAPIDGATGLNYTPVDADVDHLLRCRVRSNNTGDLTVYATAAAVTSGTVTPDLTPPAPIFSSIPGLTMGSTQSAVNVDARSYLTNLPAGATISWSYGLDSVTSATAVTSEGGIFRLTRTGTNGDTGTGTVTARYTVDGVQGPAASANFAITVEEASVDTPTAFLNNYMPRVGDILVCTVTGGSGDIDFQWQFRSAHTGNVWTDSVGNTLATLPVLTDISIGAQLRCCVTRGGVGPVYSPPTAVVPALVSDPLSASLNNYMPRVGDILVCTVTGGSGDIDFQWQFRSPGSTGNVWTDSVGQTSATLPALADIAVGAQLRCCVTRGWRGAGL